MRTSLAADRHVFLEAPVLMSETGAIAQSAAFPDYRTSGDGPREAEHIRPEEELGSE
jgi:hypothetical protein